MFRPSARTRHLLVALQRVTRRGWDARFRCRNLFLAHRSCASAILSSLHLHQFIIQLWRANIDIAPVISRRALISYLAKYISKCEVASEALESVFKTVIDSLDEDSQAKKVIHKVFMKACGERDVSAQEVCHILLRLKLYSAGGRNFVYLNMSDNKWKQLQTEEDDEECGPTKIGTSVLQKYMERPDKIRG